jgi:pimeloyl-ACP methyl ester carboxylesterase
LCRKQFESSLSDRFNLVAIDLPGHGNSDKAADPESSYTIEGYGKIFSGVVELLELENVIYVGHSLGGHMLMQNWERLPSAMGLVIFGSTPFTNPPAMDRAFQPNPNLGYFFSAELPEEIPEKWADLLFKAGSKSPGFVSGNIRNTDPLTREIVGRYIAEVPMGDEQQIIGKMKVVTAVFQGKNEQLVNNNYMDEIPVDNLWQSKIHYISDAGHSPQWENPDSFNALLEEYVMDVLI